MALNINISEAKKMGETNKIKEQLIFETGDKLPNDNFIGDAWVKMLVNNANYDCMVYNVTFAPGARNNWHKHSKGQILLVTQGEGYYQEKGKPAQLLHAGDVVEIPANVEHWHGASKNSTFVHLGITPKASENKTEWLKPVTDEEYNKLNKSKD
jgi:quercetin dioxygenase-like cupin family protein